MLRILLYSLTIIVAGYTMPGFASDMNAKSITNNIGMKFVYIKPGTFMTGSPPDEPERSLNEDLHRVTITRGYYLQTTEVTQRQWQQVMGNNPSYFNQCGENCPVDSVSWNDVMRFINQLNKLTEKIEYRLPTEAEWEYAARAGTTTPFAFGRCLYTEQANYDGENPLSGCPKGEERRSTMPVASFISNAWGLYDMHGNIREWCQDWKSNYSTGATDPTGPSSGTVRVIRGGSFVGGGAASCRSARRLGYYPDSKKFDYGFRLVLAPLEPHQILAATSRKDKKELPDKLSHSSSFLADDPPKASYYLDDADKYHDKGDIHKAHEFYLKALPYSYTRSEKIRTYSSLVVTFFELEKYTESKNYCKMLLKLAPKSRWASDQLAKISEAMAVTEKAVITPSRFKKKFRVEGVGFKSDTNVNEIIDLQKLARDAFRHRKDRDKRNNWRFKANTESILIKFWKSKQMEALHDKDAFLRTGWVNALNYLTIWHIENKQIDKAERVYLNALSRFENEYGQDNYRLMLLLDQIAISFYMKVSKGDEIVLAKAEPLLKRVLAMKESIINDQNFKVENEKKRKRYGNSSPSRCNDNKIIPNPSCKAYYFDVNGSLENLTDLYVKLKRYNDAAYYAELWCQNLESSSNVVKSQEKFNAYRKIAKIYSNLQHNGEAEKYYKMALGLKTAQNKKSLPGLRYDRVKVRSHYDLANVLKKQGKTIEEERYLEEALMIADGGYGDVEKYAHSGRNIKLDILSRLSELKLSAGNGFESDFFWQRAAFEASKTIIPGRGRVDRYSVATQKADDHFRMKRYDKSALLYQKLIDHYDSFIDSKKISPTAYDDLKLCIDYFKLKLTEVYRASNDLDKAEAILKGLLNDRQQSPTLNYKLMQIHYLQEEIQEALLYGKKANEEFGRSVLNRNLLAIKWDQKRKKEYFEESRKAKELYLKILKLSSVKEPDNLLEYQQEAFKVVQAVHASGTDSVVEKMVTLAKMKNDSLAHELLKKDEILLELDKLRMSLPELKGDQKKTVLKKISNSSEKLLQMNRAIASRHPFFTTLVEPQPERLSKVRQSLKVNEAIMSYVVTDYSLFLFIVRQNGSDFIEVQIGKQQLEATVRTLRGYLDPSLNPNLTPFDVRLSNALYREVFKPAIPYLSGIENIILIPDGSLQSIPFGVLVSTLPKNIVKTPKDHKNVDWLAKRYSFTTAPSVSSVLGLRSLAEEPTWEEPFAGFGDPLLSGPKGSSKGIKVTKIFDSQDIADVNYLRNATSIPETADELMAISSILNAGSESIFLGKDATESRVKQHDLGRYRIIGFSTHGVMAGELKGLKEPGLVLTPPQFGTEFDDGYLSSSEISTLQLCADWVLLSACNTGTPDGSPGASGLSGLSKAFFYAGARSMLVSHWPVESKATKELVTKLMKEYSSHPDASKAEALRRAELNVMGSFENPHFAHPMFWAPFVVVGGGSSI